MCAGAASSQEEKPLTPKSGEALSSIACLRAFEAQFHFRGALAAIGGVLLLAGCFWAAVRFLTSQSYLIPILAGVVCIAISAAADPQGLLRHLPAEVQDFLLNRRIFDIIHDDSPVTNAIRKWGRVQLLAMQSGSSEGVVREIVQSMGPDFVNFILCRSFLSFFPSLLQQLMLPEAPPLGADEGVSAGKSKSGLARTAARSDAWPQEDGREGAPPISWILRFLQQRNEAKMQKVTEPELLPLVVPNMLAALTERSRTFAHSLLHKLKVCAAAAGAGCVVYAATLFRGFGKKALLESLASGGLGVLVKDGEESRKKARLAAVLGLLSAGGAIVVGMSFERFNRRPKDPRSLQPSTDRPFEPEREASPPSSEVF
ncbi:unnamed protein product [Symbiodinium sp. KB8]|nr:unnamed protein product [Symbiodinium sp. KB8]